MPLIERFQRRRSDDSRIQSIIDNLNNMLNTKKEFGSWLRDYGIGDFNAYKSHEKVVETIIAEIRQSIRRYEPRVQVELIREIEADSPFRLRLEVKCAFLEFEKPVYIVIDSIYNKVYVEGF